MNKDVICQYCKHIPKAKAEARQAERKVWMEKHNTEQLIKAEQFQRLEKDVRQALIKEVVGKSDEIKKRNYRNRINLKEADEHRKTQLRLECYNLGINELLAELGIRKKGVAAKSRTDVRGV